MKERMWLKIGDTVELDDGDTVTVKSLEFKEFTAEERIEYIPKRKIKRIIEKELCE